MDIVKHSSSNNSFLNDSKEKSLPQFDNKTIYTSDFIRIINYQCSSVQSFTSNTELSGFFSIGFIRTGNFHFKSFRHSTDLYNSRILVEKPECEYRLTHTGDNHNATTFFIFSEPFYKALTEKYALEKNSFLNNKNILSLLLVATPELEYLHYIIWQKIHEEEICRLEIDSLVIELAELVAQILSCNSNSTNNDININKNHLQTIERAKEYILKNFTQNISLNELAQYCYVSPFHFSRTFKQFSAFSPYRYLQHLRLKNAEMLLKTTAVAITDICYMSGFNSPDYFSAAFTKKYKMAPGKYRATVAK